VALLGLVKTPVVKSKFFEFFWFIGPRQKVSESGQLKAVDGPKSNAVASKIFQTSARLYFYVQSQTFFMLNVLRSVSAFANPH
jgi:hypothetical protein